MDFEENNIQQDGKKGLFVVLAFCVLAVAITAFALNNAFKSVPEVTVPQNEITDNTEKKSKTDEKSEETPVTATVSDEQYSKETAPAAEFFVYPVAGEVVKNFSGDNLVYSETYKDFRYHSGMDIVPSGSTVVSAAGDGTVESITENTEYGTVICINHGNGITANYCGVKNVKVAVGDKVSANTPIAEIGIVANETADEAHLHFEMYKDSSAVSPAEYLDVN